MYKREKSEGVVLIVEDDNDMNQFLFDCLNDLYHVESAFNGKDGLKKALELKPDVVLTDLMMPEMNGDELLRQIRAYPELNDTSIILITAKVNEQLKIRILQNGAQDYLHKPFPIEELLVRVGNLMEIKEAHRAKKKAYEELEQKVKERTAELEQSNRDLDDFAYIASHDLKEPLRGISHYAQFLLEDYQDKLNEEGRKRLQTLVDLPKQMENTINEILTFSRVGQTSLSMKEVDLNGVVQEVLAKLKPVIEKEKVEVSLLEMPRLWCDAARIGEVFQNLIANGIKYNDKAEKKIEIGFFPPENPSSGFPILYVKDNGIGIPDKHHQVIFRLFKRLHERESYGGGAGVGLTIVKKIIERHHGEIWVESEKDRGTIFYFHLKGIHGGL